MKIKYVYEVWFMDIQIPIKFISNSYLRNEYVNLT
jgi:hypothetical protein